MVEWLDDSGETVMTEFDGAARPSTASRSAWLLVTDVDDTLLADLGRLHRQTDASTAGSVIARAEADDNAAFAQLAEAATMSNELILILNSSRPRDSVLRTLASRASVRRAARRLNFAPDGLITAMGTEVLLGGVHDETWMRRFEGWDRAVVDEAMDQFAAYGCDPHADELQSRFKASYAVPARLREDVIAAIEKTGQASRVVTSGADDFDVLPANAGKGEATLYVARELGVPPDRLIVAGDSANDLDMFSVARHGIAVGNARPELLEALEGDHVYRAAGRWSAGILEGLRHYGVLSDLQA